jgi:hypothetical protein
MSGMVLRRMTLRCPSGVKGKPVRIRHGPATVSGLKAASQETCLSG